MIETANLSINKRREEDSLLEEYYSTIIPELAKLDPTVGECFNPIFFSIFTKENVHIGSCSLYNLINTGIELGVRIFNPDYWGKGYGTEIVDALCEYVFDSLPHVTTVYAKTPASNTRAMRCYEKCGFQACSRAVVDGYDMIFMVRQSNDT